ncbi:hypothetical protein PR202_gb09616 [Eleusine coracana subsp. coracana]|uniref:Uncharacterized protein n=1 Tax=Eleusine coracana subsp. coracana TaxID=191504 RepID=A0AAV5EH81_ELECO|nr:hypothetical protein PR202_gb09616 [Eleusine coracana subsp. coracana]
MKFWADFVKGVSKDDLIRGVEGLLQTVTSMDQAAGHGYATTSSARMLLYNPGDEDEAPSWILEDSEEED